MSKALIQVLFCEILSFHFCLKIWAEVVNSEANPEISKWLGVARASSKRSESFDRRSESGEVTRDIDAHDEHIDIDPFDGKFSFEVLYIVGC